MQALLLGEPLPEQDVSARPRTDHQTPTPTEGRSAQDLTPRGSEIEPTPVIPTQAGSPETPPDVLANKRKTKPPAPVTPNPFRLFPAPAPIPTVLVDTIQGLQQLVGRWLQKPPVRIGVDTETTGLSPLMGARLRLLQLIAEGETACHVVDLWAVGDGWVDVLQPLLALHDTELVAHNAAFEVDHLAAAGLRIRAPLRCTLLAARLLSCGVLPTAERTTSKGDGLDLASCCGRLLELDVSKAEQVSDWSSPVLTNAQIAYAATDAWLALRLWDVQRGLLDAEGMLLVHRVESQALPAVAEARLTGLQLDLPEARRLLAEQRAQLTQLQERLQSELGVQNLNSARQVAEAVRARGHEIPTTEKGNPQVSKDVLGPLVEKDSTLAPIQEAKVLGKFLSTYLESWVLLAEADPEQRIRPQLKSFGATTGRMTCGKGDLPRPTTLQGTPAELRRLLRAAPGFVLVDGDWSAIELRLIAAIYGEEADIEAFREGTDLHCRTASAIYGREITKANPLERSVGKTANFNLAYGGGARTFSGKLSEALGRPATEAETLKAIAGWEKTHPVVVRLRNRFRKQEPWAVKSVLGRKMQDAERLKGEPGVRFNGSRATRISSTNALNWPIQSSGAELLKDCLGLLMPRLWDELPGARVAHLIHDEIILEVPEADAERGRQLLLDVMQDPGLEARYLKGVVPLVAEVRVGQTWAETH